MNVRELCDNLITETPDDVLAQYTVQVSYIDSGDGMAEETKFTLNVRAVTWFHDLKTVVLECE